MSVKSSFRTVVALLLLPLASVNAGDELMTDVVLAVHGGTGRPRNQLTAETERAMRATLEESLRAGYKALNAENGTSLDAVEASIRVLEDSPLFNAGKGSVFTEEGRNELDASIMEGKSLKAGAVASVTIIKNPITAARAVMEQSPHVLLIGRGAEVFATQAGLEIVDPTYFWTEARWREIQRVWEKSKQNSPRSGSLTPPADPLAGHSAETDPPREFGTVGAVAVDRHGNLAAGTSTGGMTGKKFGRVGDSPIIGAGTYADNTSCAVSCTGHGEYFIRHAVAHTIAALVKYKGESVKDAAEQVVLKTLKEAGGDGGVIVLDARGNLATPYNTPGLYRGSITRDGQVTVRLYEE